MDVSSGGSCRTGGANRGSTGTSRYIKQILSRDKKKDHRRTQLIRKFKHVERRRRGATQKLGKEERGLVEGVLSYGVYERLEGGEVRGGGGPASVLS